MACASLLAPMSPAAAQQAPAYQADAASAAFTPSVRFPTGFATQFSGVQDGAEYRLEVPSNWNGDLVTYSHGFVSPLLPALEADIPPLRDLFLQQGFAWASSSYSANGYVVEQGVEETEQLLEIFAAKTGKTPERVYATGVSMGGHIVGAMIERYPNTFVGALPACGVVGDQALYDYFLGHAAAAQTLAGLNNVPIPAPDNYLTEVAPQITAKLGYGPGVSLTDAGQQLSSITEGLTGGERPLFDEAFEFWSDTAAIGPLPFLLGAYGGALTGGPATAVAPFASNAGTSYQLDDRTALTPTEVTLNAAVKRVNRTGPAPFPLIDGTLGKATKVLTIHTTGDLFVPFSMEQEYRRDAIAKGTADRLVQRAIRDVGHCTFSPGEFIAAFTDLVTWVSTGVKPKGDEILDPKVVADQDFGCAFTVGERPGLPACGALERYAGSDRIRTAVDLVGSRVTSAATVVLARADDYADALAAGPLAASLDAPVLLTGRDALPGSVARLLEALGVKNAVVLGGKDAVADSVLSGLTAAGIANRRIGGATRYDTAGLVAAELGGGDAYVVRGFAPDPARGFPDAVSVSALAASTGSPILLVPQDSVPAATAKALEGRTKVTVIGGQDAVSAAVAQQLGRSATVTRVGGANRYATSAAVAQVALTAGLTLDSVFLATGTAFADALVAGPIAARAKGQLLLVDADPATTEATVALLVARKASVGELVVVGGPKAVSAAVASSIQSLVETA